ncbi:hypothetical protein EMERY_52 [Brevibacillus phage Emery]|nr:hypothetical protein EMERY_52 [Brevibacillus phage Emery]
MWVLINIVQVNLKNQW